MKNVLVTLIIALCAIGQTTSAESIFSNYPGPNGGGVYQGEGVVSSKDGWQFSVNESGLNAWSFRLVNAADPSKYWYVDVAAPNRAVITKGIYLGTRFPFQSPDMAGFSWWGEGWGCNTSTTIFDVLDIQYDQTTGVPTEFAANFVQFQETWGNLNPDPATSRWVYGQIRFNSDISLAVTDVPEPTTSVFIGSGIIGFLALRRKK
ncbi:MAG: PEP-CTERM sorting domain-containing protein [bacterium]